MDVLSLITILTTSFSLATYTPDNVTLSEEALTGYWVRAGYEDDYIIYERVAEFPEGEGGLQFLPENELIVKQNAGWCGTPPITYGLFNGSWQKLSETEIELVYGYWGGTTTAVYDVSGLTDTELKMKAISFDSERTDR